jgi:hypothetical protein
VPCRTRLPQQEDIEGAGKEERHTRERWKISIQGGRKVAVYGREEVRIDDEDKELIDEGNNVRYLRMN